MTSPWSTARPPGLRAWLPAVGAFVATFLVTIVMPPIGFLIGLVALVVAALGLAGRVEARATGTCLGVAAAVLCYLGMWLVGSLVDPGEPGTGSGSSGSGTDEAADSPVIAVRDWNAYPTADVSGRLRLTDGCLLVGESVVFWAHGTSWDATTQSVVFESADPVRIGEQFSGGGGYYARDGVGDLDGLDVESVVECLNRTDSDDAVFATPH